MKIVKVGKNHSDWYQNCECESCGAVLEVLRSDLHVVHSIEGRSVRSEAVFDCIACGKSTSIGIASKWGDLPSERERLA